MVNYTDCLNTEFKSFQLFSLPLIRYSNNPSEIDDYLPLTPQRNKPKEKLSLKTKHRAKLGKKHIFWILNEFLQIMATSDVLTQSVFCSVKDAL